MYASDLISYAVPPLKGADTGLMANQWMNDFHVRHLPVVDNGTFLGLVSEDHILNMPPDDAIHSHYEYGLINVFVQPHQHLYEIMKCVVDSGLSVVPVANKDRQYMGLITLDNLIKQLVESGSITHPGGVIVIEMAPRDYSLAEIARIIESEKVLILSSFITSNIDQSLIELTIKLNKEDLKHVVATLERFDYNVKDSFYESDYLDSLNDRYDSLIRYLNI